MKSSIAVAFIAMAVGIPLAHAAEKPASEQQVMLRVRVCEGDPLGSVKHGTIKVLATTELTTKGEVKSEYFVGEHVPQPVLPQGISLVPVGVRLAFDVSKIEGESITLGITFTKSKIDKVEEGKVPGLSSWTMSCAAKMEFGETLKVRCGSKTDEIQQWFEVTAVKVDAKK